MVGDGKTVIATAEKLASVVTEEGAATIAWVQPIMMAPYCAHAQFSSPETILALRDPGDTFPMIKGMWHYARGVALAAKGDLTAAAAEADAIDALANKADLSFLISNMIPADQLLQLARHVVLARIAQKKGYAGTTIDELQRAVALQDGLVYMEPPYWYYPVRQSLGAALLGAGRAEEALAVFKAGLKQSPNNGWVLYGLAQTQRKLGDEAGAKASEAALDKAWVGSRDLLDLSKL
jgi:tetratricopeptide (TPR) repeat protein